VSRAAAVLALTDNDGANLEIALAAKESNAGIRVVTRMYDDDLANRVERRLDLGPTRSVSMLAAPAFAAAALGRRREVIFPVGRRVVLFTEVPVMPGSAALRGTADRLNATGRAKVLAVAGNDQPWSWEVTGHRVRVGDRLSVVATRGGLARLLLATRTPRG